MRSSSWHREDIKAALRKRHGSVRAFEAGQGLPVNSVSDVLRGRTVSRAIAAIAADLKIDPSVIRSIGKNGVRSSNESDDTAKQSRRPRLNAGRA